MTLDALSECVLCPRMCRADRLSGERGYCGSGPDVRISQASLHFGEEPCISGKRGSGTLFFSNCNLSCVFCQNYTISQLGTGKDISIQRLADIFIELQDKRAHNINLVSPTHFVPQIISALEIAKGQGLEIPVLYNSNAYENVDTIRALHGLVDIYLPDVKYHDDKFALKYSDAPGYFGFALNAIEEMFSQTGPIVFDRYGIVKSGVIIRHLLLPGLLDDSKSVMKILYERFGDAVFFSIMNQYTPMHRASEFPELKSARAVASQYEELVEFCVNMGVTKAFIQGEGTSSTDYVPHFDLRGV